MKGKFHFAVCTLVIVCAIVWVVKPIATVQGWSGQANAPSSELIEEVATALVYKEDSVGEQVQKWIDDLSAQKPFAQWKAANFKLYPLGPGQNGWVAILTRDDDETEIGYLVVSATQDGGYELMEYGTGSYPLFSLKTLWNTLQQNMLIAPSMTHDELDRTKEILIERIYEPPLLAIWKVNTGEQSYVFDAKTGEQYPNPSERYTTKKKQSSFDDADSYPGMQLSKSLTTTEIDVFDPFDNIFWILKDATPTSSFNNTIVATLEKAKQIVYTTMILNDKVTLPFAVTGSHSWGDDEHSQLVMLDQYGPRFIPYASLVKHGNFYIN